MKTKVLGFIVVVIAAMVAWVVGARQSAANTIMTLSERDMSALRGGIFADCHQPEDNCPATACQLEGNPSGSKERFSNYYRICGYGIHNCDWATQKVDCKTAHYLPPNTNCAGIPDSYTHDWRNQCIVS